MMAWQHCLTRYDAVIHESQEARSVVAAPTFKS